MPTRNPDLHGNAPDSSRVVLLLVDVINDLEFDGGEKLLKPALAAARRLAALVARARKRNVPVVYANDNFGRWRSDFRQVVEHCLQSDIRGRPIAELLRPEPEDYFVLKPKHSAFYATTLGILLEYLKAERLILAGFAGDVCVQLTAADAYVRDFELYVPRDCSASISAANNREAFEYMGRVFHADTRPSPKLDLAALARRQKRSSGRR
jgi:nicotinamidase-related amidase